MAGTRPTGRGPTLGYEFAEEGEARASAADLDRRFGAEELLGLRVYRVRWNNNYIVEAAFAEGIPEGRIADAKALLGEAGRPVHPEDLADYKQATRAIQEGGLPGWMRRLFGG